MESVVLRGEITGAADGYGYGYGDGDGDGDGDGYGDGYGPDTVPYWRMVMTACSQRWSPPQRQRFADLDAQSVRLGFWRSDANGQAANGGRLKELAAPGVWHREKGPLSLCHKGTLHATLIPPKWKGERVWIVALHGEVVGDDEKLGCLAREILGECVFSGEAQS